MKAFNELFLLAKVLLSMRAQICIIIKSVHKVRSNYGKYFVLALCKVGEMTYTFLVPIHWSQTQFLEGRSPAQFSSNKLQITPAWKFLVILKSLISWIRCVL